jgi:hypothetical protein
MGQKSLFVEGRSYSSHSIVAGFCRKMHEVLQEHPSHDFLVEWLTVCCLRKDSVSVCRLSPERAGKWREKDASLASPRSCWLGCIMRRRSWIRDRHTIPSHAYAAESRQQSRHRFRRALHLFSWSCRITGNQATSIRKPMRSENRLPDLMRAASHRRYACTSRVHGCRSARLGVLLYLKLRQCTSGWLRTH